MKYLPSKVEIFLFLGLLTIIFLYFFYPHYKESQIANSYYLVVTKNKERTINELIEIISNSFKKNYGEKVSFENFCLYLEEEQNKISKIYKHEKIHEKYKNKICKLTFNIFDTDKDKYVSINEFKDFHLKSLNKIDINQDKKITPSEFREYLSKEFNFIASGIKNIEDNLSLN